MPMGKKYKKNFDMDIKRLTEKARGTKKTKVKGKRSGDMGGGKIGGNGGVKRAPMDSSTGVKKKGKIRYRKGGTAEANIIDQRGMTRETAKESMEMQRLRNALKRRKRLKKIMKGLEKKY